MRAVACALVVVVLVLGSVAVAYQDPQKMEPDSTKFMHRKLDSSRDVVEGLATEDFSKIASSAQDLMLLSLASEWNVIQTQRYSEMSGEFRSSAERLRDAAKDENLDAATLAYFEVTLNCVRCHRYVRKTK
ncbi:MAG: hypothetical protein AAGG44_09625 [Planctomycetota bacterium]